MSWWWLLCWPPWSCSGAVRKCPRVRALPVLASHLAPGLLPHAAALFLLLPRSNTFRVEPSKGFLKIEIYYANGKQVSEAGFSLCRSHADFCNGVNFSICFVVLFFIISSTISTRLVICLISLWHPGSPPELLFVMCWFVSLSTITALKLVVLWSLLQSSFLINHFWMRPCWPLKARSGTVSFIVDSATDWLKKQSFTGQLKSLIVTKSPEFKAFHQTFPDYHPQYHHHSTIGSVEQF